MNLVMTSCSLCASAAFESQPCAQRQRGHGGEWAGGAGSDCAGAVDDEEGGEEELKPRSEESEKAASERGSQLEVTAESKGLAAAADSD